MALETVIFQQDPFINYSYDNIWGDLDDDDQILDKIMTVNSSSNYNSSSPDDDDHGAAAAAEMMMCNNSRGRKRRRTKGFKNKEEMENQRMTHIAVERNRRRQMNDYLAVLRSLMPPSYAQRVPTYYFHAIYIIFWVEN